jgi:hypothetical protein
MSARAARKLSKARKQTLPAAPGKVSRFLRTRPAYVLLSAAILIPCFWQSRLQAGDLPSHLYNAWLTGLIHQGKAPGLAVVPQASNVLFDLVLNGLFPVVGLQAAQRIPVALAVLLLVWGAFAFLRAVSGRTAFHLLPAIVMLAYGWTFHMGLFNFYISLGLCFWALALGWEWRPARLAGAAALLAAAYVAHGLPVAWAAAVLAYRHIALRLAPPARSRLFRVAFAALIAGAFALRLILPTRWFEEQVKSAFAIDQLAVYGSQYWIAGFGLLLYWVWLFVSLVRRDGLPQVLAGTPFQICVLTGAGIVLIPNWILIPGYHHALVFLAQRMSLALGICICAWLACAAVPRLPTYALGAAAVLFFGFLYADESALNAFEDRMQAAVEQLPPWQRVVNGIDVPGIRTNPVTHMLDLVCIGRCYSYGNYEPSSGAFRVRVAAPNPIVVAADADANNLQNGSYIVKERDLPLYQVTLDPSGDVAVRALQAGQRTGIVFWPGL